MKLKDNFALREIAGETVVVPVREGINLDKMFVLNETGRFLWGLLKQETDEDTLVAALLSEYEVEATVAKHHVAVFLDQLKEYDFLA